MNDGRTSLDDWHRLEELWEKARALPPDQRAALVASEALDPDLRRELESLLDHAGAGEAFFGRLQIVVSHDAARRDPAAARTAADPLIGTTVAHYRLLERRGQGGMGVVYRAEDLHLRRQVALKLLRGRESQDGSARDRLLAEARAAAALDHPNICTIHEVGATADGIPYIVMAYYPGATLEQLLRQRRLSLAMAVEYARQLARGLGAAHDRGIIHRDVKPANIIVTDGVVKLLDFGIARSLDAGATQESLAPGTIAYMAPEQIAGSGVDRRTDLWSLGVVLYEMCAGTRPFGGENAGAIGYAILNEAPPRPALMGGRMSRRVASILERLLAKNPERRYADATQLGAELTRAAEARGSRVRRALVSAGALLASASLTSSWSGMMTPTVSERRLAAQDAYAQGNRDVLFRSESGRRQAMHHFRQAVALDSTWAVAHAGLAHLLVLSGDDSGGSRLERLLDAEQAARDAIRRDSLLADAHAAFGHVLLFHYQLTSAEREFRRAVTLDSRTPYVREFLVWLYIFMDRPRDALREAERAVAEHPESPTAISELARALVVNGRCDQALALLDRLAYLQPPPARVSTIAAQCHAQQNQWQRAIDVLRPDAERNPRRVDALLAFMLARAGHTDRALQIRDTLSALWRAGSSGAYELAVVHAGLGDFDRAFEWLERSIEDRSLRYNIMEPMFVDLHRDARFAGIRRRLGIRAASR
jgi:serine/threonine-protein kinase